MEWIQDIRAVVPACERDSTALCVDLDAVIVSDGQRLWLDPDVRVDERLAAGLVVAASQYAACVALTVRAPETARAMLGGGRDGVVLGAYNGLEEEQVGNEPSRARYAHGYWFERARRMAELVDAQDFGACGVAVEHDGLLRAIPASLGPDGLIRPRTNGDPAAEAVASRLVEDLAGEAARLGLPVRLVQDRLRFAEPPPKSRTGFVTASVIWMAHASRVVYIGDPDDRDARLTLTTHFDHVVWVDLARGATPDLRASTAGEVAEVLDLLTA